MAGGMPHTETFDPKKYTPFTKGMEANSVLSTFPSVPTAIDGVYFSEGLEYIGKVMDKGTIIRSYVCGRYGPFIYIPVINITGIPVTSRLNQFRLRIWVHGSQKNWGR